MQYNKSLFLSASDKHVQTKNQHSLVISRIYVGLNEMGTTRCQSSIVYFICKSGIFIHMYRLFFVFVLANIFEESFIQNNCSSENETNASSITYLNSTMEFWTVFGWKSNMENSFLWRYICRFVEWHEYVHLYFIKSMWWWALKKKINCLLLANKLTCSFFCKANQKQYKMQWENNGTSEKGNANWESVTFYVICQHCNETIQFSK